MINCRLYRFRKFQIEFTIRKNLACKKKKETCVHQENQYVSEELVENNFDPNFDYNC